MTTFLRILAIVVANALAQAAMILDAPVPGWHTGFVLVVLASFVLVALTLWALTAVMASNWNWRILAAVTGTLVVATASGIFLPALTVLVLTIGIALVCCVANQVSPVRFVREHPIRTVIAVVGMVVGIVLLGLAAVGLGFLVTGAPGAFLTWLVAGFTYVSFVRVWTVRSH